MSECKYKVSSTMQFESENLTGRADLLAGLSGVKPDVAASSEPRPSSTTETGPRTQPEKSSLDDTDDPEIQPDILADQMNKLNTLRAKLVPKNGMDEDNKDKADDPIEKYYFDAQQAMLLASAGGLANAMKEQENVEKAEKGDEEEQGDIQILPEIGRSLFFALRLTTWEDDENVVLEVGWAATWWQEELSIEGQKENAENEAVGDSRFERITEQGHIM